MNHPWGINWLKYHQDQQDLPHIERMGYRSIKLFEWMWNNRDFSRDLNAVMPADSIYVIRDIPLSDQHDHVTRDPEGAGIYHADEWAKKVAAGWHLPLERCVFQGVNEYDENGKEQIANRYWTAYARRCREHGIRPGTGIMGTGHPSTIGRLPTTKPNWADYEEFIAATNDAAGFLMLHEYAVANNYMWGFHLGRSIYCPYAADVIYDEFGIDYGTVESGNLLGYLAFVGGDKPFREPQDYLVWLDQAQLLLRNGLIGAESKLRVHSLQIFAYDTDSRWKTFDIRPIRSQMESYPWSQPLPSLPPKPDKPAEKKLFVPFVRVPGEAPSRSDAEANWKRSLEFVVARRPGFVNDPADPGGATKWGITFATFKWWRRRQGMADPSLSDLQNMREDERDAVYRQLFWEPSGSGKLPYPVCLIHFDTYTQSPALATRLYDRFGDKPLSYLAERLRWHTRQDGWSYFGVGWMRRVADLYDLLDEE